MPRNQEIQVDADLVEATRQEIIAALDNDVSLAQLSRLYVRHALARAGGNKCRTADTIGVDRRTIQRWMKEDTR